MAEEFQVSFANMNFTYKSSKKYNIYLQIKNLFSGPGGGVPSFFGEDQLFKIIRHGMERSLGQVIGGEIVLDE